MLIGLDDAFVDQVKFKVLDGGLALELLSYELGGSVVDDLTLRTVNFSQLVLLVISLVEHLLQFHWLLCQRLRFFLFRYNQNLLLLRRQFASHTSVVWVGSLSKQLL